ncbi:Nal1-like putative serine protease [Paraburkholderia bannensis]|uniref:hypothetical protein n=1 Tax=Paraburkholderia bannensis TaxID=765414 RepID=UPI002ABE2A4B|nr:hypothetical protein [Paraburkholderia bannensis]
MKHKEENMIRNNRAREVAEMLSRQLFAEGRFDNAPGGSGTLAAAAAGAALPLSDVAFSGVSIQAIGYEVDGGNESTVHIYVSQGTVAAIRGLETEYEGVKIRANKMASLRVNPQLAAKSTNRGNLFVRAGRIACGSSCAPSGEQYSGTFGALISDNANQIYGLSNNHVIAACNHVAVGMPILAPSTMDSHPTLPAPREIGRHSAIVELRSGEPNLVPEAKVDAAAAFVPEPTVVTSWQGDLNQGYDTPTNTVTPSSGMQVKKWGRTTGLTTGVVEAQLVRLPLPYKTRHFTATVYFKDVWTIRSTNADSFALPGDSGSLVVTEDGQHAVGLIFATTTTASNSYGVMVPIDDVLADLHNGGGMLGPLRILGNHGL